MLPAPLNSTPVTTLTAEQLQSMLGSTAQVVIAQAQAQGVSPDRIAQLRTQLSGLMSQAQGMVAQQGGSVQVPTASLSALASNLPVQGTPTMTAQGLLDLPNVPSFLSAGGLDNVIDYLIDGLGNVIGAIPFIGPALSTIVKNVGGSLKAFLVNNALAAGVVQALTQAGGYYAKLQNLNAMADTNRLLGLGTQWASDRLNGFLVENTHATSRAGSDLAKTPDIRQGAEQAKSGIAQDLAADFGLLQNDGYKDVTGYSKYSNPLTATGELSSLLSRAVAARDAQKAVDTTAQSLTAVSAGDDIVKHGTDTATALLNQGEIATAGVASETTALGINKMLVTTMVAGNNAASDNAQAILAMLRQSMQVSDANVAATSELIAQNIRERRETAQALNSTISRMQADNLSAATSTRAAINSIGALAGISTIDPTAHPLPGPHGEGPMISFK